MIWQRYPVFRIFLVFSGGILLANFFSLPFIPFLVIWGLSALVSLSVAFAKGVFGQYRKRWWFGLFLNFFYLTTGVVITHLYSEKHAPLQLLRAADHEVSYLLELLEEPREKEHSVGVKAKVLGFIDSTEFTEVRTKLMLYLQKTPQAKELSYGDRILVSGRLNQLNPPMNPHEFDYRNYLNLKAIYYQAYADSSSWKHLSSGHGYTALKVAGDFRKKMLAVIDEWDLDNDQKSVTKALLLGYRFDIEDDLLKAYSSAGAMHVLAVSGLHVGIVYLMAFYLLYFLDKVKYGTWIKTVILILLLWAYAMITGLSASVVRAATMFTFVAVGTGFKRYTSIYNTILGSAILLMLIKPTFLFEVGFQLSYAAVFGIVWLQPRMESLWKPSNWILKQFWAITTVSIAAQVATFPLGLYYFHQFPALFLISNWMVIPIVTGLMYIGLGSLVFSALGWVPGFLVSLYGWLLGLMNAGVGFIEKQAEFLLDEIHITRFELVLLYIFVIAFFNWLFQGKFYRLALAMVAVLFFGVSQGVESYQLHHQREMVVYSVRNQTVLGFYEGQNGVLVADSTFWQDDDALTFHVKHHWWAGDLDSLEICDPTHDFKKLWFRKSENLIAFGQNSAVLIDGNSWPDFAINCWIVKGKTRAPKDSISFLPQSVILTGRHYYTQEREWHDWAAKNAVELWDVNEQGAYVVDLNQ